MRSGALRIAVIYIIVALVWIMLSDRILFLFRNSLSAPEYLAINSGKGFFFVILTGLYLSRLIRASEEKLFDIIVRSVKSDNEVERLGAIIKKVNNIIIITDKNNFINWVNNAFEDFTGYSFEEVAGYSPATFFVDGDTDAEAVRDILQKKKALESFAIDLMCHKKNDAKFWVHGEFAPIFDAHDEFAGYIAVYNDITPLKEKEHETIRQNDKLKEVAWLSSHEVRRPLANIIGLAGLMKDAPYMDEKLKILEIINRSAEELDRIVHRVNLTIETEFEQTERSERSA